jgi:acyl-CoA thioesterase
MTDFFTLTTPERNDEGGLRWRVPEGWRQGRGAYGGMVVAAAIRAMEAELDEPLPLRTVNASLTAPVLTGEEAHLRIELLRRGSNTITLAARIEQNGELRAHTVGLFGRRRVTDGDWNDADRPEDLGDWKAVDTAAVGPPLAPEFAQNFEYRVLDGFPFSGAEHPRVAGWIRADAPGPARDAAYLAGCIDAYWPVPLASETSPRPMATVSFMMEFLGTFEGLAPDAPLFYQATSPAARDGYTAEFRELWGADGRLLAMNQQSFCIIR